MAPNNWAIVAKMYAMGGPVAGSASRRGWDVGFRAAGAAMVGGGAALSVLPALGPLCPLRRTTGVPCPLCGMTTGVFAFARGDIASAFAANPLAPLLIVVVLLAFVPPLWRMIATMAPPDMISKHRNSKYRMILPLILVGPLWIFQLHRYEFL